jgi:hypothetical protein
MKPGDVGPDRRRYRRFDIDLPIRYTRPEGPSSGYGRAMNVSEGGLLMYSPEQMDIGQHLKSKIFFLHGAELDTIEMKACVIWTDLHLSEAWGDFRSGLKLTNISPNDMGKLKYVLTNLLRRPAYAAG